MRNDNQTKGARARRTAFAALIGGSLLAAAADVLAINGLLFYGLGARNRAMGGAGAAAPLDTSTILINPAGLGELGSWGDVGIHALNARRTLNTSLGTPGQVNTAAGNQRSQQDVYLTPMGGLSYKADGSRWGFGFLVAGVAGEGAKYNNPRIDPALLTPAGANYDTSSFLFIIKGIPALSYDVTDRLTVGAGLHVNAALFSADIALGAPGFPQTAGDGRLEISYGLGAQVGATYAINQEWSVGGSFTTTQWFDDFGDYEDLIPDFELPPEVRVGVAYRPGHFGRKLLLTADYKWIGWSTIDLFDRVPSQGGFGWDDQHTVGAGAQYDFTPKITGRVGFNYGATPIREESTFANALVPVVYEWHLAGGVEYKFDRDTSLALSLVRTLRNDQTDPGTGDVFSAFGRGTKITYNGWDIDLTWSVRF